MQIKHYRIKNIITNFIIILSSYFFVLRYIFPKYFMPLVGHHSDMIDYAYDQNGMGLFDFIFVPRGVGQFICSLFQSNNYQISTLCYVAITMINIYLLFLIAEKLFNLQSNDYIYKVIYTVLIFAHPGFYINYTYDLFSTIALTFFLLLIINYYNNANKNNMLISIVLILLCGLSKETYLVSIVVFFLFNGFFLDRKKEDKILMIVSIILSGFIIYWNKKIGSPFNVMSNDVNGAYYTNFNIKSILSVLKYYLKDWGNIITIILFGAIIGVNIKDKNKLSKIIMLVGMNIGAYAPYTILPNHVVPHYKWVGVVFGYLILFALADRTFTEKIIKFVKPTLILATIGILAINTKYVYQEYYWAVKPELINANILSGFEYVEQRIEPSDNILITGLYDSEETIYKSLFYVKNRLPYNCTINVATIRESNMTYWVKLINVQEIMQSDLNQYNKIFVYSSEGKIQKYINLKEEELDSSKKNVIVYPQLLQYIKEDMTLEETIDLGNVYNSLGLTEEALTALERAAEMSNNKNPYPYFFMGNVYERIQNYDKAKEYYKKAKELDTTNNPNFIEGLSRIEAME